MKKLIALFLSLIIVFSLCGCNNTNIEKTIWASEFPLQDQLAAFAFDTDGKLSYLEALGSIDNPDVYYIWGEDMSYKFNKDTLTITTNGASNEPINFNYEIKNNKLTLSAANFKRTFVKVDSLEKYFNDNGKTIDLQGSYEWVEETKKGLWWW